MHRLPVYIMKIASGVLLGLLVYILVEKNTHRHTTATIPSRQTDHAAVHSGYACLICEFQLSANAGLPAGLGTIVPLSFSIIYSDILPAGYLNLAPSSLAERGPPVFF